MANGFRCRQCGQVHDELPMHYGTEAPEIYYSLSWFRRRMRCRLTPDLCIVENQHFYILGNLEIPVTDSLNGEPFSWDVWVSLSAQNFARTTELWEQPGRESEPPYFGWLSIRLPGYPDTLNLKTMVHTREVGQRPYIELEPTDHPLAVEQRTGITMARVQEIAELVLHPEGRQ